MSKVKKETGFQEVDILDAEGKAAAKTQLPAFWFQQKPSRGFLHEVAVAYAANQRQGDACAKTRAEVSGGGRKPWKQKHTGRARHGSIRSPLWRKGGVVFGPRPRDYRQKLPRAKWILGLAQALSAKALEGRVQVLRDFSLEDSKTKKVRELVERLQAPRGSLLVLSRKDEKLALAARNLEGFGLCRVQDLNAARVLGARRVIFMDSALKHLSQREKELVAP